MANSIRARSTPATCYLLLIATLGCSGCVSMSSLQDWSYHRTQKSRATAAWQEDYDHNCRKQLGSDYHAGYKVGFVDSAMGQTCDVPPVPPPKYWTAHYQSCDRQECIQNWFRGYQAGQTAAQTRGFPEFHQLPTSASAPVLNKTACGTCYSPTRCECENASHRPAPSWSSHNLLHPRNEPVESVAPAISYELAALPRMIGPNDVVMASSDNAATTR